MVTPTYLWLPCLGAACVEVVMVTPTYLWLPCLGAACVEVHSYGNSHLHVVAIFLISVATILEFAMVILATVIPVAMVAC